MSTVEVVRREAGPWFETAIYGYGTRSEVMGRGCGTTLAKAVRVMQDVCANQAGRYRSLQESLEKARAKKGGKA